MSIHQRLAGSVSAPIYSVNKKNCAPSYISTYWRTGLTRCGYHQTPYTRGFIAMAAPDRHTQLTTQPYFPQSSSLLLLSFIKFHHFGYSSNFSCLHIPWILLPLILDQRHYRSAKIFTPFHICVFAQLHFCMIGGEVKL